MTKLDPQVDHVVLINTFTVKPGKAEALVELLGKATDKGIRKAPGFISANLHISLDGTRVVNYAQWRSNEDFEAMQQSDTFKAHTDDAKDLIERFDPVLYKLKYSHSADGD